MKRAKYWVQIIKKIEETGRTERGTTGPKWAQSRKSKETELIMTLRTAYPYGLNDKISDDINSTMK